MVSNNSSYKRVNPLKYFETDKDVSPLLSVPLSLGVATNQTVVAAVTGKRIRVMGGIFQSNGGTIGFLSLKDGSGGTVLSPAYGLPTSSTAPNLPFVLPFIDTGYFETTTGVGLFADVTTAAVIFNIFYITYTP